MSKYAERVKAAAADLGAASKQVKDAKDIPEFDDAAGQVAYAARDLGRAVVGKDGK